MSRSFPAILLFLSVAAIALVACAKRPQSDQDIAKRHFAEREYRAAIVALERDLVRHPESYESQVLIGLCHEKLGDHDAALAAYRKTLALNPVNGPAFAGIARISAAREQWNEAWQALTQAHGPEANETLLSLYPQLKAAYAAAALTLTAPDAPVKVEPAARTVGIAVTVRTATIKQRESILIFAAPGWTTDLFERLFFSLVAATATDRIRQCHDRFFARHQPSAIDAIFPVTLDGNGAVLPPDDPTTTTGKGDMNSCVRTALATVRFPVPSGTD